MYLEFFGMRELPFTLTPNMNFFIDLDGHQQVLDSVQQALRRGAALVKITGSVGAGKSLLCRHLLATLPARFLPVYVPNPFMGADDLLRVLADELGVPASLEQSRQRLLAQIGEKLDGLAGRDRKLVLLVDEAQAMDAAFIETLALLVKPEAGQPRPLQLVLFGKPELDALLNSSATRLLGMGAPVSCTLPPLDHDAVNSYVAHRLACAGYTGTNLFHPRAIDALFRASAGLPRYINILCHKALLVAYGRSDTRVTDVHVLRAVEDTEELKQEQFYLHPRNAARRQHLLLIGAVASGLTLLALRWFNL